MRLVHERPSAAGLRAAPRRPYPGRSRLRDRPRLAVQLVVLVIALVAMVAGSLALADRLRSSAPATFAEATLNGLSATIATAGWVSMDAHSMDQAGFQMPQQMMPGAPAGDRMRLGVPITLLNTDSTEQRFILADEFAVVGGVDGGPVLLHSDTFGLLNRLAPGAAVNGVLYFDLVVPAPTDPPLLLRWVRDSDTVDIAIPMAGAAPDAPHPHG